MSEPVSETTDSALSAEPKYLLDLVNLVPETTKKKCNVCETTTMHQWVKIGPLPVGSFADTITPDDFIEMASKNKRVIMCQQCGTISVTK